jgi:hypothetical protein
LRIFCSHDLFPLDMASRQAQKKHDHPLGQSCSFILIVSLSAIVSTYVLALVRVGGVYQHLFGLLLFIAYLGFGLA